MSGKYDANSTFEKGLDYRSHMPQYTQQGFEAAQKLMAYLTDLAGKKNATSGQLSLAWILCKKPYLIPIPGSRKEERLWENLRAKDIRLSENEIAEIDALLDRMEMPVYGQRPKKG